MALYTVKYQPQNSRQVFGQDLAVSQLREFIINYKSKKQKIALLYGPLGTGKTCSVYALAQELGYDILEINSSDLRNAENIHSFLGSALGQQSLFFRPKVILIDEIDNVSGVRDRGGIPAIVRAVEKSSFPVIATANDLDNTIKPLTKISLLIPFNQLEYKAIAHCLLWIAEQEHFFLEEKAANSIARQAAGDLRGALIDLQICAVLGNIRFEDTLHLSDRKRTQTIVNALRLIFKSSAMEHTHGALDDLDVDLHQVFLWMDYNLPLEYRHLSALARAYEHLSRADVFQGRITKRQHWRFLVYIYDLLTAGVSSAKDEKNTTAIEYKQTTRLLRIWQSNMKNLRKKDIAQKLAKKTHTSAKVAREQIPYLKPIFQRGQGKNIAEELGLSDEEVQWLRT